MKKLQKLGRMLLVLLMVCVGIVPAEGCAASAIDAFKHNYPESDIPMVLYQPDDQAPVGAKLAYGVMLSNTGVYSGPGYFYSKYDTPVQAGSAVRMYTKAFTQDGLCWVMIEYAVPDGLARGYVPQVSVDGSTDELVIEDVAESLYMMQAIPFEVTTGRQGPGEDYISDGHEVQDTWEGLGTIILGQGEWCLFEEFVGHAQWRGWLKYDELQY